MNDKAKTKMTINIMGVDYQVITDDDPNRVKMIADFVDTLIKETKRRRLI
jgi:cell division protein ZapA (FtsZ GTPase activity inhibitor)